MNLDTPTPTHAAYRFRVLRGNRSMPSIDSPSLTGIEITTLSERARALLREGGTSAPDEDTASNAGTTQILLWTFLVMNLSRLRRFADHVGMLGAGIALRHVLDGRRIAAFREQLGQELYQFGMLKAPLIGTLSMEPTAFDDPERALIAVRESGLAALQAFCLGPDAQHLHLRARLSARLQEITPPPSSRFFVDPPSSALLQRVLREVEPVLASALDGIGATP